MIVEFLDSIKSHGYVGNTGAPLLAYLTLVSPITGKPVSTLIKGSSGAGKSYALKVAQRYVPETAFKEFSGMSEKALAYMGDNIDLKHKTLIIQEAAGWGGGDGRVFLRQLITEGKIDYVTVQSSSSGLGLLELPPVEGPCGVMMTTTETRLYDEDESRFLSYSLKESPEHMGEILLAKALERTSTPSEEELKPFHDHYEKLHDTLPAVVIPFLEALATKLPTSQNRIARDFDHIISLIKTVALLHCCERETGEAGQIIATLDDYEVVRELLEDQLAENLELSTKPAVREVVAAVGDILEGTDEWRKTASQTQVVERLGRDKGWVSRAVKDAVAGGYLLNRNPGQGRLAELAVGTSMLRDDRVFPLVEELAG